MMRERCSCGAEFETDSLDEREQLAEWRSGHAHRFSEGSERVGYVLTDAKLS